MSHFTDPEIGYLQSKRLGRLATVNKAGEPHVIPIGFRYNPELDTIDMGGRNIAGSKKVRDIIATGRAAIVIDDVLPPWTPRGVEIRGRAEVLPTGGQTVNSIFGPELIRLTPTRIISWGVGTDSYGPPHSRKVG